MTQQEFADWSSRLFIAFPSLNEWLIKNSPDKNATLRVWFSVLQRFTLKECDWVLDGWSTGGLKPFEAYERDKVHLLAAAHIGYVRDRASKRQALQSTNETYRRKRHGKFDMLGCLGDSSMVAAYEELRPLHRQMQAGEISEVDYAVAKAEAFEKHGINRKKATA